MTAPAVTVVRQDRLSATVQLAPDWQLYRRFRTAFRRARPAPDVWHWIITGARQLASLEAFAELENRSVSARPVDRRRLMWAEGEQTWQEAAPR